MLESGAWKSFDDIESHLTLDELVLLRTSIDKRRREDFKMQAALQGHQLDDDDYDEPDQQGDDFDTNDPMVQKFLEADKAYKEQRAKRLAEQDPLEARAAQIREEFAEHKMGIGVTVLKANENSS